MFLLWCHLSLIFHVPCCLCIWEKQSHPLVFTDWLQERQPSVSLIRDSEAFSNLFYGYTCSTLLVLFCGEFLGLYAFCTSCTVRPSTNSLLFIFPRAVLHVQVSAVSPNPAELVKLSHVLTSHLQRFTLIALGAESWPQGRMWGVLCVGQVCRVLGVPVGQS